MWDYFKQHDEAPGKEGIELIFWNQIKDIPKADAKDIEEMLSNLSEYNEKEPINVQYLLKETQKYFLSHQISLTANTALGLVHKGKLDEAEKLIYDYKPAVTATESSLNLNSDIVLARVDKAFNTTHQPVITYPRQLGRFWNDQLIRGGFVSLLASDKKGKSFFLLDMAMKACSQNKKVCFFQAGDMSEASQLRRICIYLAQKSDQEKYCGLMWEPVRDCVYNQIDECEKEDRCCGCGIFVGREEKEIRYEVTLEQLITAYENEDNVDYKPCSNCKEYETKPWGAVWIQSKDMGSEPLTSKEAQKEISDFFIKHDRHFKLSSHANGTLSIKQIEALLSTWEKQEDFVPDLIVVDYADLLVAETKEFRHGQDEIWRGLRKISQQGGQPLVVTATQADAGAYEKNKLTASNFSEDKRKHAHITAEYALNQDTKGREKKLGIIRIGEIMMREGDFNIGNEVTVLQNLRRGRPFIASYF